ncbi:MAG: hypothetical protein HQK53_14890 [Oligoflexia bacterium]|nr:hypothetical protein [Oligoflexia bacterium]
MCDFYDPEFLNECRELMAENVVEKDKVNFCSYFRITSKSRAFEDNNKKDIDAAESLFKDLSSRDLSPNDRSPKDH